MPTLFHFLQGSAAGAPCDAAYFGGSGRMMMLAALGGGIRAGWPDIAVASKEALSGGLSTACLLRGSLATEADIACHK